MNTYLQAGTGLAVAALTGLLAAAEAAPDPHPARTLLAEAFDVTAADFTRLDAGRVVSRTLDVEHNREVATLGIVRIEATPDAYVERLLDIAVFKRDADILQIGTFSSPPVLADVSGLTLEVADVRRIRECRVGDCDVQLSADAIERLRAGVDWRGPAAAQQATGLMRRILVDHVIEYTKAGDAAAIEYADTSRRLSLASEFASLVSADTTTWRHVPHLRTHVLEFPAARADDAVDLVYWSKERVRNRPVISVTHLAVLPGRDHAPVAYAIASKQIYAMHYFDVSLGVTLLLPDRGAPRAATYVVYLNRSRIDLFDGVFGAMARRIVSGRARALVAQQLERISLSFRPSSSQ